MPKCNLLERFPLAGRALGGQHPCRCTDGQSDSLIVKKIVSNNSGPWIMAPICINPRASLEAPHARSHLSATELFLDLHRSKFAWLSALLDRFQIDRPLFFQDKKAEGGNDHDPALERRALLLDLQPSMTAIQATLKLPH